MAKNNLEVKERQVEVVPIESVKPYPGNARNHSEESVKILAAHIKDIGFKTEIRVDENMVILQGHGRLEAAKMLGMTEVPIIIERGMSKAQKARMRVGDNRLAEMSEWNPELLIQEMTDAEMDMSEWFSPEEISDLYPTEDDDSEQGGVDADAVFIVSVECDSETQQETVYQDLHAKGLKVKCQTL